jgi:hypothetical protein
MDEEPKRLLILEPVHRLAECDRRGFVCTIPDPRRAVAEAQLTKRFPLFQVEFQLVGGLARRHGLGRERLDSHLIGTRPSFADAHAAVLPSLPSANHSSHSRTADSE